MSNKTKVITILMMALLGACALPQKKPAVDMQSSFNNEEYNAYTKQGTNTLKGQAFLRQKGGSVVTCSGSLVYLMPATLFFREISSIVRVGRQPMMDENTKNSMKKIVKQSQCDAQGNFKFEKLPAASWLVVTDVRWLVGSSRQGGELLGEATTSDGGVEEVLLTETNLTKR